MPIYDTYFGETNVVSDLKSDVDAWNKNPTNFKFYQRKRDDTEQTS